MQTTSQLYNTILASDNYAVETRLTISANYVNQSHIISCSTSISTGSGTVAIPIGNTPSSQIDISLYADPWVASKSYAVGDLIRRGNTLYRCNTIHSSATFDPTKWHDIIPRMAKIILMYRLVGSSTSEWIQKGVFYVDTRSLSQTGVLDIHGYDGMLRAEACMIEANAGQENWPKEETWVVARCLKKMFHTKNYKTSRQYYIGDYCRYANGAVHDVATYVCTGMTTGAWDSTKWTLACDTATINFIANCSFNMEFPGYGDNGLSMRSMLNYIAACHGGNFYFDSHGVLTLKRIKAVEDAVPYSINPCEDSTVYSTSSPIKGVKIDTGKSSFDITRKVETTTVHPSSPTIQVKGSITITRKAINDKNITATANLKFLNISGKTWRRWRAQLAFSDYKNNRSSYVDITEHIETWASGRYYEVGDQVVHQSVGYTCRTANHDSSFTSSKWTQEENAWITGENLECSLSVADMTWYGNKDKTVHIYIYSDGIDAWRESTYYAKGTYVQQGGNFYKCKTSQPASETSFSTSKYWTKVTYRKIPTTHVTKEAEINVIFNESPRYNANLSTQNGETLYFEKLFPGYSSWKEYTAYSLYDHVVYENAMYECNEAHTSDEEWESEYWDRTSDCNIVLATVPWAKQIMVNNLYDYLNGYSYQAFSCTNSLVNPAIDYGDYISITHAGETYNVYALDLSMEYGSRILTSISSSEDSDISKEYSYGKNSTSTILSNLSSGVRAINDTEYETESEPQPITTYKSATDPTIDNEVIEGDLWYCTAGSAAYKKDVTYRWNGSAWVEYEGSIPIDPWVAGTSYESGDCVQYQGKWYICNTTNQDVSWTAAHWDETDKITITAQSQIKKEIDKIIFGVSYGEDYSKMTMTYRGIDMRSSGSVDIHVPWTNIYGNMRLYGNLYHAEEDLPNPWKAYTYYAKGKYVTYNSQLYRCNDSHTSTSSFDSSKWDAADEIQAMLIGVNNSIPSGHQKGRLQIGSAYNSTDIYQDMSIYGGGSIYFMADVDDSSITQAELVINDSNVTAKVPIILGVNARPAGAAADYVLSINSDGKITKSAKQVSDIAAAVFG